MEPCWPCKKGVWGLNPHRGVCVVVVVVVVEMLSFS